LGAYIFDIKREDARRALEALYLEEGTDPHLVLEELRVLRFDLDEYIRSVEGELAPENGRVRAVGKTGATRRASAVGSDADG
jgi:hypothetical protein